MKKTIAYRPVYHIWMEPEGGHPFWKGYHHKLFGQWPREDAGGRVFLRNNLFVIEENEG
jgi:hypothetical protein